MPTKRSSIDELTQEGDEIELRGLSICPGIGVGHVRLIDLTQPIGEMAIGPDDIAAEQERYTIGVEKTKNSVLEHVQVVHGSGFAEAEAIFRVHQAILEDESFHDRVRKHIAANRTKAEWSVWQEASSVIEQFNAMRDPYFKARGEDIRDMAHNLISVLQGTKSERQSRSEWEHVMISQYMHSSDVFLAERGSACGFASESRAILSHAAILLKGFGIPSVAGVEGLTDIAHDGDDFIVDGTNGLVIVRPSMATIDIFQSLKNASRPPMAVNSVVNCATYEGTEVVLRANIENPRQVKLMHAHGLDGIGLFRTEFLITNEGTIPSDEEQYRAYRFVIESANDRLVTIRTFDIGGDKSMGLSRSCNGINPSMGLRGIRRHLVTNSDEFRTQLRAILRAAVGANVGILIPMVTTVEDVVAAKGHLNSVAEELSEEEGILSSNLAFGVMIETPAAAAVVQRILLEVDFVSVGTNDLLQYFMAADRDNESVLHYHDATNPAFLWIMRHIIEGAQKAGRVRDVTVCGEIASDIRVLPHLLKMGYRSFSISPVSATSFRNVCF